MRRGQEPASAPLGRQKQPRSLGLGPQGLSSMPPSPTTGLRTTTSASLQEREASPAATEGPATSHQGAEAGVGLTLTHTLHRPRDITGLKWAGGGFRLGTPFSPNPSSLSHSPWKGQAGRASQGRGPDPGRGNSMCKAQRRGENIATWTLQRIQARGGTDRQGSGSPRLGVTEEVPLRPLSLPTQIPMSVEPRTRQGNLSPRRGLHARGEGSQILRSP